MSGLTQRPLQTFTSPNCCYGAAPLLLVLPGRPEVLQSNGACCRQACLLANLCPTSGVSSPF